MADNGGPRALSDRYVLLDRLGSGGMGTVWRATDRLLNRTVAVKEMHLLATGRELTEQTARMLREAHTVARMSHPNVVNVYDLVDQDGRLWLVMEFVDGPSLQEHVATTGPMSASAVAGIGLQLLSALEAVHAAGVLHRDVKPGNVLLRRDGRAVLCDFGIAALSGTDPLTASGAVVGSFEYIAPERLSGRPVGPPSDLFSLGVTLCVLLSGRSPFARPEIAGVLNAVIWKDAFGSLADDGIDAVMRTPDDPKQYWVFSGDQYVRTTLDGEGPGGDVTYGPANLDGWPGTFGKVPAFRLRERGRRRPSCPGHPASAARHRSSRPRGGSDGSGTRHWCRSPR
ncbi:serine/threonine-protein kinase [Nonomuraea sp. NPDC049714]|uniref:serine/threonine-protein kinase n=1 Tax=Nonomuraea sp. NPDC049714 TaxID=3364357 RepID=UPI003796BBBC